MLTSTTYMNNFNSSLQLKDNFDQQLELDNLNWQLQLANWTRKLNSTPLHNWQMQLHNLNWQLELDTGTRKLNSTPQLNTTTKIIFASPKSQQTITPFSTATMLLFLHTNIYGWGSHGIASSPCSHGAC